MGLGLRNHRPIFETGVWGLSEMCSLRCSLSLLFVRGRGMEGRGFGSRQLCGWWFWLSVGVFTTCCWLCIFFEVWQRSLTCYLVLCLCTVNEEVGNAAALSLCRTDAQMDPQSEARLDIVTVAWYPYTPVFRIHQMLDSSHGGPFRTPYCTLKTLWTTKSHARLAIKFLELRSWVMYEVLFRYQYLQGRESCKTRLY